MKLNASREKFAQAFQLASPFCPSRSPKPILQNIKLDASGGKVTLMATDLEVGIRVVVDDIEIQKEGACVLPMGSVGAILRESLDERIKIETTGKQIQVKGDRAEFKLPAGDPAEFADISDFGEEKYHRLSAPLMKQLVLRTEFATEAESSRYALGGVLLELEEDKIIAVGTDGRRLAKMEGPAKAIKGHKEAETNTIVRAQSMRLIGRSISDNDGDVDIAVRANDLLIRTNKAVYYSRLLEGRFPKWRDVVPKRTSAETIALTVGSFFSAIRQAAIVATTESRGVDFAFTKGLLTLQGSAADQGQSKVDLPVSYDGEPITVSLDFRFVIDLLKVLPAEGIVTAEIENGEAAVIFKTDEGSYAYVVMPLARDQ